MKTKALSFLMLIVFAIINQLTAQKNSGEAEAIKKVLDQETRAYFEQKYDLWASTWVHDSSAFRMTMSPTEYYKISGWDSMNAGMKESMQKATPYTQEEMAPYLNKFDYKFYINGNTANVFFKEGKTEKDAEDEMRVMVKQNGQWKITGITIINKPAYNFSSDVQKLKTIIGKWGMAKGSFKDEPADTAFTFLSFSADIHEIMNGIESKSSGVTKYAGTVSSSQETEQFITDNNTNKFWYYDNIVQSNGYTSGGSGTAAFDSAGNFVVTVMYADKPVVRLKNIYTLNQDASLHLAAEFYNKEGKKTYNWSCDMIRM